jgi:hypothetical protein
MGPQKSEGGDKHHTLVVPVNTDNSDSSSKRLAYIVGLADQATALANKATALADTINPEEASLNPDRSKYKLLYELVNKLYLLVETIDTEASKAQAIALAFDPSDTMPCAIAARAHADACADAVARADTAFDIVSQIYSDKRAAATRVVINGMRAANARSERKHAALKARFARDDKAFAKTMRETKRLEQQRIKKEKAKVTKRSFKKEK